MIKTVNLTKRYKDVTAVDRLTLQINKGELFALLGLNGAGKTTTVKMLSCLTCPTDGDAFVGGYSITAHPSAVKKLIAVSPQETAVAPLLTVRENLKLMAGIYGFPQEDIHKKVAELTERFHLQEVLNKKAATLSGGWQRRVSIAMALIGEPQVLFLDEPTLGLDVIARSELWEIILALKGQVTVVLTTHYMEEAAALSDRIGIVQDGRLLALGTVTELTARAKTATLEDAFIRIVKEGI